MPTESPPQLHWQGRWVGLKSKNSPAGLNSSAGRALLNLSDLLRGGHGHGRLVALQGQAWHTLRTLGRLLLPYAFWRLLVRGAPPARPPFVVVQPSLRLPGVANPFCATRPPRVGATDHRSPTSHPRRRQPVHPPAGQPALPVPAAAIDTNRTVHGRGSSSSILDHFWKLGNLRAMFPRVNLCRAPAKFVTRSREAVRTRRRAIPRCRQPNYRQIAAGKTAPHLPSPRVSPLCSQSHSPGVVGFAHSCALARRGRLPWVACCSPARW